ncbi:MAG TPA: penicillin acylase family protein [Microthrixaceae bacterium]|nr:penicillin acylase family protein [Microthrixaceae bacterium]
MTGRALFRRVLVTSAALALVVTGCTENIDWDGPSAAGPGSDDGIPVAGVSDKGYSATIRRTEGNVAHITADSLKNVSFGQGWASGEDRTCDLADQVIKVTSQRAKYFGPGEKDANLNSDFAWLTVGIAKIATDDWEKADPEVRSLITAYTDGWNAHLNDVGPESIPDWCAGAPWLQELKPVDVYIYARSIGVLASSGAVIDMIGTAKPPTEPGTDSPGADSKADESTAGASKETAAADNLSSAGNESALSAALGGSTESPTDATLASNGWAIGKDRTEDGGGMLLANPHFPWVGELRFWEVHLTVPGVVDMYGVQLSGLPGVAIGFNENFGWTHTVSAGFRMTAYKLNLVPGSPTTYKYGDEERELTPTDYTVEVLGKDGKLTKATRTTWRSQYGPVLDFPGFGWTKDATISFRDANINNDEFITQYMETLKTTDLDGLIALNRKYTGVPLFNTIAVSNTGRAWYADTSATPNLSKEALKAYSRSLKDDPIVKIAKDSGAILLDGSNPLYEWQNVKGARDPGLVPFDKMPMVERSDYVFNANDSFWMANASQMIEGDYSILHGEQRTPRSPRTRENATVLSDVSAKGPSGSDGLFSLKELENAALQNRGFTSRALLKDAVERCTNADPVSVEPLGGADGKEPELPGATVDLAAACKVLADWDGVYDIDRAGPAIWREFMTKFPQKDLMNSGTLWAKPFDYKEPVATPAELTPAPATGTDPVLVNLARAVQSLEKMGVPMDVELGTVQTSNRNGKLVPIHGGSGVDGTTNVVTWGGAGTTMDPERAAIKTTDLGKDIAAIKITGDGPDRTGYPVDFGTSFLMALHYTADGPVAKTFLTYGNVADVASPSFLEATERFSKKQWKNAEYTTGQVDKATISAVVVKG